MGMELIRKLTWKVVIDKYACTFMTNPYNNSERTRTGCELIHMICWKNIHMNAMNPQSTKRRDQNNTHVASTCSNQILMGTTYMKHIEL